MKKVLIVMGVAASLVACNTKSSTESTEAAAQKEAVGVKVVTAERVVVDLYETYTSEIKAYKENDITPAVQGLHIDQIKVDVGDRVKEGQVLVTMDQTTLKQQELNLATTQDSYNRMKPVHEAGGVADQQMIQLKNQLDLQKEVVENLRKNSTIKSPISGIVTARNFESGDLFASMPILHIMQINKLKVKANVSEMYYPVVKVGQKVDIEVDIFPGEKFEGKVTRINPALDAATRTFGVEITIDNANERLRPGMYARTTFNMGQKESIVINDVAVQKQSGSSARYVYVIKDGKADYRFVEDGRHIGNKLQILSGIEEGEQIAITSFNRLVEGAEVEIINE
jgi:RND family efflux transporter MFP subunit